MSLLARRAADAPANDHAQGVPRPSNGCAKHERATSSGWRTTCTTCTAWGKHRR